MRLANKQEFIDEYMNGFMQARAMEFQEMDAEEVEAQIEGCLERAANLWATFKAYKATGEKMRRIGDGFEQYSQEYYESLYEEKAAASLS